MLHLDTYRLCYITLHKARHAHKNWKFVTWKFQYVYWMSQLSLPQQQIGPETRKLKNIKVKYTYCCDALEKLWGRMVSMVTGLEHTASRIFTVVSSRTTEQIAGVSSCPILSFYVFNSAWVLSSLPHPLQATTASYAVLSSFKSLVARYKVQQR
jgi:hypothetical protein